MSSPTQVIEYSWFQRADFENYYSKKGHKGKHGQYSFAYNCGCFLMKKKQDKRLRLRQMLAHDTAKQNESSLERTHRLTYIRCQCCHSCYKSTAALSREPGGHLSHDVKCLPRCHFSGFKRQWPGSKISDKVLAHPLFELYLSTMTSKFGMQHP